MALGMHRVKGLSKSIVLLCLFQLTKALVMCSHPLGKTATLKVRNLKSDDHQHICTVNI